MTLALGLKDVEILGTLGETEPVKLTLPAKPKLLRVIEDEAPPEPHTIVATWLALMVKSALTVTETVTECVRAPLTAFNVTV